MTDALLQTALEHLRAGRVADVEEIARAILGSHRHTAEELFHIAQIADAAGLRDLGLECWDAADRKEGGWPEAKFNAALSVLSAGRPESALERLKGLLDGVSAEHPITPIALNAGAAALIQMKTPALSLPWLRRALALAPSDGSLWGNLSDASRNAGHVPVALAAGTRGAMLSPGDAGILNNLALAFAAANRPEAALCVLRKAIAIDPQDARSLVHTLDPCVSIGAHAEARTFSLRLIALAPTLDQGRYAISLAMQAIGDLPLAWQELDRRFGNPPSVQPRPYPQPWWDGAPLPAGKKLLVWGEQGVADELQFGSMLSDLAATGIPVVVECDSRVTGIFTRTFPTIEFVPRRSGAPEVSPRLIEADIGAQIAIGSLAKIFRPTRESFYRSDYRLVPDPSLRRHWRQRLAEHGTALKVGISWRSARRDSIGLRAHTVIEEWKPIFDIPDLVFVNLQYHVTDAERRFLELALGDRFVFPADLDAFNDLENLLALSSALDLAITTVGTSGFFPAAAGIPTWQLIRRGDPLSLGMGHRPWFPKARGFTKRDDESWARVMADVSATLRSLLTARRR